MGAAGDAGRFEYRNVRNVVSHVADLCRVDLPAVAEGLEFSDFQCGTHDDLFDAQAVHPSDHLVALPPGYHGDAQAALYGMLHGIAISGAGRSDLLSTGHEVDRSVGEHTIVVEYKCLNVRQSLLEWEGV